ncbi:MAG: ATP-dependent helicase HrpB, partial [Gammaproteobacteria bacterium]
MTSYNLPIEDCLDELKRRLNDSHEAVLEAPPGAGKTTLVPLALMDQPWLGDNKIVMLQPRRLATKSSAYRIADLIDQSPGDTIGYRMRLESKTGKRVKVEIVTEGIFTRMLQQDPSLAGVGLVIFDEFHERNLDSDLGLALCLQGRSLFRDQDNPLKILIMSATLDSAGIVEMLGNAPLIRSEGRAFPVDIIYGRARQPKESVIDRMFATIKLALSDQQEGSILAFVPGQGEIRQLESRLSEWLSERGFSDIHIRPLYGHLTIEEQQNAIAPLSGKLSGQRKVVLATNIAETSLTIEGIDIVVDSGLAREPRFDPTTGMSGLHTVKVSKASTVQRAGRAGRLAPGLCYRLWSEEQQGQLLAHSTPEIMAADLAPLAMQLLQWGIDNPDDLCWLNPPPNGPWQQALELLQSLGAIEEKPAGWVLTDHGHNMGSLPVHPRLAHCLIRGAEIGEGKLASFIASLLSERDPLAGESPDIADRIDLLSGSTKCAARHQGWLHRCRQLAAQFERQLEKCKLIRNIGVKLAREQTTGYLLACAYPDRIGRRRHSGGYQLANGRSARFYHPHRLDSLGWLVVAEVSGSVGGRGDIIRSAAILDDGLFNSLLSPMIKNETIAEWDKKSGRFIAEAQLKLGALVVSRKPLETIPLEIRTSALL